MVEIRATSRQPQRLARPFLQNRKGVLIRSSVTLVWDEKPFTAAYDGQMALDADELQYAHGYGPCVDADRAGQVFLVEDMRSDQRWPNDAQSVAAHGVRGVTVRRRDHRGAEHLRQTASGIQPPRC